MMWKQIKKLLQKVNKVCILIEEGKPSYVILPFQEYEQLIFRSCQDEEKEKEIDKINKEINNWKENTEPELEINPQVGNSDEIKIEDLPIK